MKTSVNKAAFKMDKHTCASAMDESNDRDGVSDFIGQLREFSHSAVSSDSPVCSRIGKEILEREGSVADAAIATMLCLNVVNCHNLGIGGGVLFTIYKRKEKRFYTLDARETAPLSATRDMYESDPMEACFGPRSVGVPGQIAGFWELHQKFGKLPWKDLLQPSIDLCRNGFEVREGLFNSIVERALNIEFGMEPFINPETGRVKKIGDIVKLPKLAKTLEDIAEHGAEYFYSGKLADKIVEELRGGIITKADLEEYQAKWRDPVLIDVNVRGQKLTLGTMPPPSSGSLIGFILKTLGGYDTEIEDLVRDPLKWWHRFMEVSKFAYAARAEFGDVDFADVDELLEQLSSDVYPEQVRSNISDESTHPYDFYGNCFFQTKKQGTSHLSVMSKDGDAISATGTSNLYFASRVIGGETGIIYNDTMEDFSQPGKVNHFGLSAAEANFIEPGKRPMSSMSPVIITDENNDVKFICGASGGSRIISVVSHILWRCLFFGHDLKEATDAPRIFEQWIPDSTLYEKEVDDTLLEGLRKLGHVMRNLYELNPTDIGAVVQTIERRNGRVLAYAERRKGGGVDGV